MVYNLKKIVLILLIIVVFSFEIITFASIFFPKVSLHYKIYYIEHKLKYWNDDKFNKYKRFFTYYNKDIKSYLSKNGWYGIEPNLVWSKGKISKIYFPMDNVANYTGILKIKVLILGNQIIKLYVNKKFICKKAYNNGYHFIECHFNPNILKKSSINVFKFKFSNPHSPSKKDNRKLAMALMSFELR